MRRRLIIAGVGLVLALGIGLLAWRGFAPRAADADVLSGYVEGNALYLASPVSGSVTMVGVVQGQRIDPGAALFTVDARSAVAQRDAAMAQLSAARAQATAARSAMDQQKAGLEGARAQALNAGREAARYTALQDTRSGAVSAQESDRARTKAQAAEAQGVAAAAQVRNAEAQARAADAAVVHAEAALADSASRLAQLSVRAPAAGRVEEVFYQTGEWAPANQPILSLIPDGKVKLRFYVPEREVSLYPVGARVRFGCDACRPGQGARISYVSPRPEYTPPIIYSRKARDRLVFLVEALPDDAGGLNPGQPVDVTPLGHRTAAGR